MLKKRIVLVFCFSFILINFNRSVYSAEEDSWYQQRPTLRSMVVGLASSVGFFFGAKLLIEGLSPVSVARGLFKCQLSSKDVLYSFGSAILGFGTVYLVNQKIEHKRVDSAADILFSTLRESEEESWLKRAMALGLDQSTDTVSRKTVAELGEGLAAAKNDAGRKATALQALKDFKDSNGQNLEAHYKARLALHESTGKYHHIVGATDPAKIKAFHAMLAAECANAQSKVAATPQQILGGLLLVELNAITDEIPGAVEIKDNASLKITIGALMAAVAKTTDLEKEVARLRRTTPSSSPTKTAVESSV